MMKTKILYLFTRTPLHVGAGASVGAVDQPIQRERHTGFPIIPGSSIKGVIRDHFLQNDTDEKTLDKLFGFGASGGDDQGHSGSIAFSEAKLLAFPLRSAKGSYALATCSLALCRYSRDKNLKIEIPAEPEDMSCLAGKSVTMVHNSETGVALEEYRFKPVGEFPEVWAEHLSALLNDAVLRGAKRRFVLLSDGDFGHFAINACQINQHVRINSETGTAEKGGLFNEESVPPETLFYSPVNFLSLEGEEDKFTGKMEEEQLIQFGGNNTTGLGFCTARLN